MRPRGLPLLRRRGWLGTTEGLSRMARGNTRNVRALRRVKLELLLPQYVCRYFRVHGQPAARRTGAGGRAGGRRGVFLCPVEEGRV